MGVREGVAGGHEIGAAVWPVAVEEQVEQRVAQVVVVRHLALRRPDRIPVPERGPHGAEPAQHPLDALGLGAAEIGHAEVEEFVEGGAFLQHQATVHVALRSEEHTSELQSLMRISYAVFCLKKKKQKTTS